jgi:hypothetical protein
MVTVSEGKVTHLKLSKGNERTGSKEWEGDRTVLAEVKLW